MVQKTASVFSCASTAAFKCCEKSRCTCSSVAGQREVLSEALHSLCVCPWRSPPRKHIVDTYTEFYHTPTHSDASKKRLIEDTEDWHPRTGTTQSRSFRILAQITGTDHSEYLGSSAVRDSGQHKLLVSKLGEIEKGRYYCKTLLLLGSSGYIHCWTLFLIELN